MKKNASLTLLKSFIKKIHRAGLEVWECIIFGIKMAFCPKKEYFTVKNIRKFVTADMKKS